MVTVHQEQNEKSATMEGAGQIQTATSLRKAQQVAQNILNLSQSELEDFISPADSSQSTASVWVILCQINNSSAIISLEIFKMNLKESFLGTQA